MIGKTIKEIKQDFEKTFIYFENDFCTIFCSRRGYDDLEPPEIEDDPHYIDLLDAGVLSADEVEEERLKEQEEHKKRVEVNERRVLEELKKKYESAL